MNLERKYGVKTKIPWMSNIQGITFVVEPRGIEPLFIFLKTIVAQQVIFIH